MRSIQLFIFLSITLLCQTGSHAANDICYGSPPGDEAIPGHGQDIPRRERVEISKSGATGYITIEYIEAANFQSSIFVAKGGKYCLAGELGGLYGYSIQKSERNTDYYDIETYSKSGSSKYVRRFGFDGEMYKAYKCAVTDPGELPRPCSLNDE